MIPLIDIPLKTVIERLEQVAGVKLPRRVIGASIANGVLHIRFSYPRSVESDVEPLPPKTPVFLFRDSESGEVTAVEAIDAEELLKELGVSKG